MSKENHPLMWGKKKPGNHYERQARYFWRQAYGAYRVAKREGWAR